MHSFQFKFEELPNYKSAKGRWSGLNYGEAEISFDQSGDWFVSDIWLECDNRKCGKDCQSGLEKVHQQFDAQLFAGLNEAIQALHADRIEEAVASHLADDLDGSTQADARWAMERA